MYESAFPAHHRRTDEFAALPAAVGAARRNVAQLLQEWGLLELIDAAQLVLSELVTNAVQASGVEDTLDNRPGPAAMQRILLQFQHLNGGLLILVWDCDPRPPVQRHANAEDEGGRGLHLVDALSSRWGHYWPTYGGKVVWAEINAE